MRGAAVHVLLAAGFFGGVSVAHADVRIAVGAQHAPFMQNAPSDGGLLGDIVRAALEKAPQPVPHVAANRVSFDALEDTLVVPTFDMAVGFFTPDCGQGTAASRLCTGVYLSDPVLETVVSLFTRVDGQFEYQTEQDLHDKTVCLSRVATTSTTPAWQASLDSETLVLPSVKACFGALMAGEVDAVAANEFHGVALMFELDLTDQIVPLPTPLARPAIHIGISKWHWAADAHVYRVNAGLAQLRQSGEYGEIVARHVQRFWANLPR